MSENGRISVRSGSGSHGSMPDSCAASNSGVEQTMYDGLQMPAETKHFVHSNDSGKRTTQLETVYNRESLKMEPQLKFVNNDVESLKMENHFDDELDEVD